MLQELQELRNTLGTSLGGGDMILKSPADTSHGPRLGSRVCSWGINPRLRFGFSPRLCFAGSKENMLVSISLIIAGALSYVAFSIIYNIFFHPLAKIPGPFLAKISSWPSFYHSLKGDRHIWQWKCFQIYGKKFRAMPNMVLFQSLEAYNDIYSNKANVKKSKFYDSWPRNKRDINTLSTTDLVLHAKKRGLVSHAFTEQSTRAAAVLMTKHIARWTNLLLGENNRGDEWSDPRDLSVWADQLTFDIAGDLAFGIQFETKEPHPKDSRFKEIPGSIIQLMVYLYPVTKSPLIDFVIWVKPRGLNTLLEAMAPQPIRDYYSFVEEVVAQRLAIQEKNPEDEKDLFHFLCTVKDPATNQTAFDKDSLLAEAHLLIIAGTHTTGASLSAALFYLSHNPRVYAKLAKEIRSTFDSEDEILQGPRLLSCTYLRACIDETNRIAPPGPSELPRVVLKGGITIDGEYYPAGVTVGNSGWSNGHNEEVFGDCCTFRPERWIISEEAGITATEVSRLKRGFTAFGKGPDSCLGREIALLILMLAIARTVYSMDLRTLPGSHVGEGAHDKGWGQRNRNVYQLRDLYMATRDGPILQFRRRQI
ncbi:benzoate 4-monooxygenase cytochrome P450 [Lojkania enalia]|uniref:Benzoate 4-monooxygenase cytochrome P450 n=1 Tax=Lojkania enalia TaxID=147567 RepID=A0A9P4KHU3_9PLEO|nr:benzoate 4-monooxygenase cytochrome P450 [Didymosphaeria enalia]